MFGNDFAQYRSDSLGPVELAENRYQYVPDLAVDQIFQCEGLGEDIIHSVLECADEVWYEAQTVNRNGSLREGDRRLIENSVNHILKDKYEQGADFEFEIEETAEKLSEELSKSNNQRYKEVVRQTDQLEDQL